MSIDYRSEAMRQVAPDGTTVELVQGGFEFLEGPVWDVTAGHLIVSDIPADTMYALRPGNAALPYRKPSRFANGNTFDREGRLITCEHVGRRVSRLEQDGTLVALATQYDGKRLNSPNDVVVRSDGVIIFTDPPYGLRAPHGVPAEQEIPFQGVYRLDRDGTLTLLADDFDRPNGLAFSPDERTLYIDDTARGHIRRFSVTEDGRLADGALFAELSGPGRGRPDGMKVDRNGAVYCTGPGGVWVFNPDGELLGIITVPEQTANLAWAGDDWRTLYLTASTSIYRVTLGVAGVAVGPQIPSQYL